MTHRPLDPRICNASIDANALDRDGSSRDALVDRLLALYEAGKINLILPKGVRAQAMAAHESPRTTKLYDRTADVITLDEVERIVI